MTSKTQVADSSAKKSLRPSSVPSGLDAVQLALIARLGAAVVEEDE